MLSKKVNLASQSCCAPAAKLGVIACINDAWETKLAFISLTICTQLCCIDESLANESDPPFFWSGLIYGTVCCGDMQRKKNCVFTIMQMALFAKYTTGLISSLSAFEWLKNIVKVKAQGCFGLSSNFSSCMR